jgi:hypothetical protein
MAGGIRDQAGGSGAVRQVERESGHERRPEVLRLLAACLDVVDLR